MVAKDASKTKVDAASAEKEYTCGVILPPPIESNLADEIFAKIAEAGFKVVRQDDRELTAEQARELLAGESASANFEALVSDMSSGPVKVLLLR